MKLTYIVHANTPPDVWAHSLQIMNMCRAFSEADIDITLLVPKRKLPNQEDFFEYYNIPKTFSIIKLPCIDIQLGSTSRMVYWLRFVSFYISARVYAWRHDTGHVYSRDIYASLFFPKLILEMHSFPQKVTSIHRVMFFSAKKIVVLTSFIKERFIKAGINPDKIHIAPDGVDIETFEKKGREIVIPAISSENFVYGYSGTLKTMDMEKGVADCIRALTFLKEDYKLVVVGGEVSDIEYYKNMAKELNVESRVIFVGKVPHSDMPSYNKKCSVLVAPFPDTEHYSYFMSPLKIFEYMASKRPMVVTDLPSLREVLVDGKTALFVPPSNPQALAGAIQKLREDTALAHQLSENAYAEVVEKYTWNKRARNILDFIENRK